MLCQSVAQVDLSTDGVCEVRNEEDVLDVSVEHALQIGWRNLWCEGEGGEEESSEGVVWSKITVLGLLAVALSSTEHRQLTITWPT